VAPSCLRGPLNKQHFSCCRRWLCSGVKTCADRRRTMCKHHFFVFSFVAINCG
jgi:hypothetical protein